MTVTWVADIDVIIHRLREYSVEFASDLVESLGDPGCGRSSWIKKLRTLSSLRKCPTDFELRLAIPKFRSSKNVMVTALSESPILSAILLEILLARRKSRTPIIFSS